MRNLLQLLLLMVLSLWVPFQACAEDPPLLDTQAMAIMDKAAAFLENMDSFAAEGTSIFDVIQDDGQRLQFEKKSQLIQQRPDKLYFEQLRDDGDASRLWYDGKQVSILRVDDNAYAQFLAPDSIDDMLDMLENLFKEPHPLADLLYSDLGFLLTEPDESLYVGSSMVAGVACSHLAFRNTSLDWQIWVENSETPFIRKVVVTYRNKPGVPQFVSYLHEWKVLAEVRESTFSFKAPENAKRLSVLLPPVAKSVEGGGQ